MVNWETIARKFAEAFDNSKLSARYSVRHNPWRWKHLGKQLDPHALNLAAIAHIRHTHTRYDELLSQTGDQKLSRDLVREEIEQILTKWSGAGHRGF